LFVGSSQSSEKAMGGRWFHIAVILSWLLSMGWLFIEKLLPTFRNGERPAYDAYLAQAERAPEPACWRLQWEDEQIGWALMRSFRREDDTVQVRSIVQFESLPVDRLFTELMGTLGQVVRRAIGGPGELRLDVAVITTMEFAATGDLRSFQSRIQSDPPQEFMRVEGVVADRRMRLTVFGQTEIRPTGQATLRELYQRDVDLPAKAMVADAFSPQPRLADLRVGQRWTFPVYRPFPPGGAAEIVEACVERQTTLVYAGEKTPVLRVVFRREAGTGISADQEPTGRMWVRADGTVLRQEIRVANLRLTFHRVPGNLFHEKALLRDAAWDE
jgi:hypothetical protein